MDSTLKPILEKVANTIRVLSAEAIEKAASGHPGLPMGCAELGAYLYTQELRHNPKNPNWMGRDRFVLSAGHGSMFLYSLLHLTGYGLSMDELKNFRQLHSKTPGHPEYHDTPGVETTTGPLGQGIAAAMGMAMAHKLLRARFGVELFENKVFVLAGDGCMMEGISHEAGSLAGHMRLNNLVIIYDSNQICLDGTTAECFSDDTASRFESYGFHVIHIDGHDFDQIEKAFQEARVEATRPVLIIASTIIGKGAPTKEGTNKAHGEKLGQAEIDAFKDRIGWTSEKFFVPEDVTSYLAGLQETFAGYETEWNGALESMKQADPERAKLWDVFYNRALPEGFDDAIYNMEIKPNGATRNISNEIIQKVAELVPFFIGGSADLSGSDKTGIKGSPIVHSGDWSGRNIKWGVREFAMATANYGIALHGMLQPMCGTFLTFSDYMRNALRVCALMKQNVIFHFTHDSIFLGEDGPTHQPIEHYAALRAMPNLTFIRPADENELKAAWIEALKIKGPVAFSLTRQNIKSQGDLSKSKAREGVARGGYVLYGEPGSRADVLIAATGSEVGLAMDAAKLLEAQGKTVRVVSMPIWSHFDAQSEDYRKSVLGGEIGLRVSVEAGVTMGWHKYVGSDGLTIGIDSFGASAPDKDLAEFFGLTPEKVASKIAAALPETA